MNQSICYALVSNTYFQSFENVQHIYDFEVSVPQILKLGPLFLNIKSFNSSTLHGKRVKTDMR